MFVRGDSIGFATLRELYLLHVVVNGYFVNIDAIFAKQLSHVVNSPIEDIKIGG